MFCLSTSFLIPGRKGTRCVKGLMSRLVRERDDQDRVRIHDGVVYAVVEADDVMRSYKRRWDIRGVYYRDCKQCLGMASPGPVDRRRSYTPPSGQPGLYPPKRHCLRSYFQHVFNGANSIGAMCEALQRFAAIDKESMAGQWVKLQKFCQ